MKILNTIWFTGMQGPIGIVLAQDDHTGDPKAYIGHGLGYNSELDTKVISQIGAPLLPSVGEILFRHFNPAPPKG
jgi:hypothetical protein